MRHRPRKSKRRLENRELALATLALMRRERLPLSEAAQMLRVSERIVLEYARPALRRGRYGEYWARPYDRLRRTLNFLTRRGPIPVTTYDSQTATDIADHMNAVRKYVRTGDTSALEQFKNKSFIADGRVHRFVTDPDALDVLADAGSLASIENLYYARMAS